MTSPMESVPNLSALAGSWTLDPSRTSITLHTKALWLLPVNGTFQAVEGAGTVGADGSVTGMLVVDATSVNTENTKRDQHLRSADFFDVQKYPTIVFTAPEARPADTGDLHLDGDLTVHGQTHPLTIPAHVVAAQDTATVTAEVHLDRSNWGLTYTKKGSRLATHVVINAHFIKS
ncbi:YceI family protein [Rhodococcus jostii]|uniref:Polyisoprenoid-binding protein YceI n=1 Tax=Rhodococcus jostii TaxID=132919 RepID=A0A1H5MEF8_RHOJO|nr:YceI family protein [Rhodococcus jostii]SEE87696.1 Polyisoprenoid-binding protein YceI [Rhodococcus jostii]